MANYLLGTLILYCVILVIGQPNMCITNSLGLCWKFLQTCSVPCQINYCLGFASCDSHTDFLQCHSCNTIMLLCIDKSDDSAELPSLATLEQCQISVNNTNSYSLTLIEKKYPSIKNNSLAYLNVSFLDISSSQIESIEEEAFDLIIELKHLVLKDNKLTSINFGKVPKKIELLYIDDNMITFLGRDSFSSLVKLQLLNLESNMIEFIDKNAFSKNRELKLLSLLSNKLRSIEFRATEIQNIILKENDLETIESYSFERGSFKLLKNLDLSANRIGSIKEYSFVALSNLVDLNLNSNKINNLQSKTFENMSCLTNLDLSNAMIKEINGSNVFSGLTRLKSLYLSNNNIKHFWKNTFSELKELEVLTLDSNLLVYMDIDTFKGLGKLIEITLNSNHMTKLIDFVFRYLTSVESLNLENNKLRTIEPNAFVGICKSLTLLYLNKNKLQFLKNTHFNSLVELVELHIAENQISSIEIDSFS
jgi:Leucine-rich repeat (LRR) protein